MVEPNVALERRELIQKIEARIDQQLDEIAIAIRENRGASRPRRLLAALTRMLARLDEEDAAASGGSVA